MTNIVLNNITSGYNISKINSNFTKIAEMLNDEIVHTTGGDNTMSQDLDMNSNDILNVRTFDVQNLTLAGSPITPDAHIILPDTITTQALQDGAVTEDKLADGSVTDAKITGPIDSAKLSFLQAGTGAVSRNFLEKVQEVFSVKDFGAKGDGSVDETVSVQKALDAAGAAGGGTVYIPKGRYKFTGTSRLNIHSNTHLVGVGAPIFDFTDRDNTNPALFYMVGAWGSVEEAVALTADAPYLSWVMSFDTSSFAEGDLVKLVSDATYPESTSVDIYKGEYFIIDDILSSTQARMNNSTHDEYTIATNARIFKVNPVENVIVEGITFLGQGRIEPQGGDFGLGFTYCRNITVKDCVFKNIDQVQLEFRSCYDFRTVDCHFSHTKYTSLGVSSGTSRPAPQTVRGPIQYQMRVSDGSQYGVFRGCVGEDGRHMFNTGTSYFLLDGDDTHYAVGYMFGLNRHILVDSCFSKNTWHAGFSTHNDGDFVTFNNCVSENSGMAGFNPRSKNIRIIGCEARACSSGILLSGSIYSCIIDSCKFIGALNILTCDTSSTINLLGNVTVSNCEARKYQTGIYLYSDKTASDLSGTISIIGNRLQEQTSTGSSSPIRINGAFGTVSIMSNISSNTDAAYHIRVEGNPVNVVVCNNILRTGLRPLVILNGTKAIVANNIQSGNTTSSVYSNSATTAVTQNNI